MYNENRIEKKINAYENYPYSVHTFEVRIPVSNYRKDGYKEIVQPFALDKTQQSIEDNKFRKFVFLNNKSSIIKPKNYARHYISKELFEKGVSHIVYVETKLVGGNAVNQSILEKDISPNDYPTRHSYIQFRVNPRKLMGYNSNNGCRIVPGSELKDVFSKLRSVLSEHGFDEFDVSYALICRLDICTNLQFPSEENAERYLKILRKGYCCRGLSEKYMQYSPISKRLVHPENELRYVNSRKKKGRQELSFYLKHRQIVANKKYYSEDDVNNSLGQLRIEWRLEFSKLYYLKSKERLELYSDLFFNIPQFGKICLEQYFSLLFGKGRFVSTTKARELVEISSFQAKTKAKMIRVIEKTRKSDLIEAFDGMKKSEARRIMQNFNQLGVSPITIPDYWKTEYENPIYYIYYQNINHDGSCPQKKKSQ